ncbi:MAG: surface protein [Bacteroidetes bacterium]|nr:surface protein [Bacteroidota bacterium]
MYFINGFINIKIVLIMRKKYFLAKLAIYGFLTLGAATTFVGCKDYDGDITDLQTQIDDNKADYTSVLTEKLAAVNTQITTLQGTQTALQATVATAQTAANAAKTSADAAAAAAAAAQLAAAQAKLDAINTAASALATVKTALETRISTLDGKFAALQESVSKGATKDELTALNAGLLKEIANAKSSIEADLTTISGQISAVDSKYNTLAATVETLATKSEVEASLASLKTELAALYLQKATFDKYEAYVGTKLNSDSTKIADLQKQITDLSADLTSKIAIAKNEAINAAVTAAMAADAQQAVTLEAMWKAYIAQQLDNYVDKSTYEAKVAEIKGQLEDLSAQVTAINANLNTMNAIFSHRLTSMAFIPEFYTGGVPTIIFSTLYYTDLDQQAPKTTLSTSMHSQAKYRMNPNGVMLSDINDFVFTGEKAETKGLGTDPAAPISVAGQKLENGVLTLDVTKTANFAASPKFDIVSLKATLADKALTSAEKEAGTCVAVYSDYVKATEVSLDGANLNIAKNGSLDYHYALTQAGAQNNEYETSFVYNGQLDLKQAVASCYLVDGTHKTFNEAAYGLCYRFAMASSPYNKIDNGVTTNQQDFASVTSDGIMTARVYQDNPLAAAAGRTPIVKVELVDASNHVVKRAFIKVKITANKRADIVVNSSETITLGCSDDIATFKINAERMNREVYNVIPMTHAQAMDTYTPDATSVTSPVSAVPQVVNVGIDGVLSTEVHWVVPESQFGVIPAEGKDFVATLRCIPRYPDSDLPDLLFKFTVKVCKPAIAIVGKELTYWDAQQAAFKVNVAVPSSQMDNNPANCIYSADLTNAFNKNSDGDVKLNNKPSCGSLKFVLVGANPSNATGFAINGDIITFNRNTANAAAIAELEKTTLYAKVKAYYEWNGNIVDLMTFNVQFIKPLGLSVTTDGNFTDAVTGGSVLAYYYSHHSGSIDVLVKDWREESLTPNTALWSFYGLDGVWFDTENAKTNLKEVGGNLVPTAGYTAGALPTDVLLSQNSVWGSTWLKYVNNGTALTSDYELFIPVTITHKWGTLKTTLTVPVKRLPSVGTRK